MGGITGTLSSWPVTGWNFLNEPAWRWGLFFVMVILFLGSWREVQRHMGA